LETQRSAKSNIVLVGMPGAGKSTVGVILAKVTGRDFVDTDVLIQLAERRSLQEILDAAGYLGLRTAEERAILRLDARRTVIATGGSAVYSAAAMAHLRAGGLVVFLDVPFATVQARIRDYATRGIARRPEQSFEELFEERAALYRQYADLLLPCDGLTQEEVAARIRDAVDRGCGTK
jgi:shikimate kinase